MYTVYSKEQCPQCTQAVTLLKSKGLDYTVLKLDQDYTRDELFERCPVPVRSVPQIFNGDEYVGGLQELRALLGELSTNNA